MYVVDNDDRALSFAVLAAQTPSTLVNGCCQIEANPMKTGRRLVTTVLGWAALGVGLYCLLSRVGERVGSWVGSAFGVERLPDVVAPPPTPTHSPQNRRSRPRPSPWVLRWEIDAPAATQAQPEGWQ